MEGPNPKGVFKLNLMNLGFFLGFSPGFHQEDGIFQGYPVMGYFKLLSCDFSSVCCQPLWDSGKSFWDSDKGRGGSLGFGF